MERLQFLQSLAEYDAVLFGVTIEQCEAALGFGAQNGLQDAEDRGDATARRESDEMALLRLVQCRGEAAHGCHHLDAHALLQLVHQLSAGAAAGNFLHRDAHLILIQRAAADAVAPAQLFAVHGQLQREVLPVYKGEIRLFLGRNAEPDDDAVGCFLLHTGHFEGMEPGHAGGHDQGAQK